MFERTLSSMVSCDFNSLVYLSDASINLTGLYSNPLMMKPVVRAD